MGRGSSTVADMAFAGEFDALFRALYLRFHRRDRKRSELSGASRAFLMHLAQAGPLTVGECARHLNRAQSVASGIIQTLVRQGLLARVREGRRTLVWLTDSGRDQLLREQEVLSRELLDRAAAKLSQADLRALFRGTRALLNAAALEKP
jgi:DNA-binding MarR family transcriptional regulator